MGPYKSHNTYKGQINYDCPLCDDDKHSGNLEINYHNKVMKCWKCADEDWGLKGSLRRLIKRFGNRIELKMYDVLTQDNFNPKAKPKSPYYKKIVLPKEFQLFVKANQDTQDFKLAYEYMTNRGITWEELEKFHIGFCAEGKYAGRIVVPSYDKDGEINFFVARSYVNHKQKYDNPFAEKQEIICNEMHINWNSTIYLVEGMFDMIGLGMDNTIPLLGKVMSPKLFQALVKKAKGYVVIILDPDAKKSAYSIYNELHSTIELHDKVRVVDLPLNKDLSEIKQEFGKKGILRCLTFRRKLVLKDYVKYLQVIEDEKKFYKKKNGIN